jgi:hypothetical protein
VPNLPLQLALLVLKIEITDEKADDDDCCYDGLAPSRLFPLALGEIGIGMTVVRYYCWIF